MYSFSSTTTQLAMKTAHQKSHRKHIPSTTKCAMAFQAIGRQQTITNISKNFDCSRTTVHALKNRALEGNRPTAPRSKSTDYMQRADFIGSSSSIRLLGHVGNFSRVSLSH